MKLTTILLLTLTASTTQAAVLDMVPLGADVDGRTYQVERKFYDYGSDADGYKYKGTRVIQYDSRSRSTISYELYFDCSDATMGTSTPTTHDVVSGTINYSIYEIACLSSSETTEPPKAKPIPLGIRPLSLGDIT